MVGVRSPYWPAPNSYQQGPFPLLPLLPPVPQPDADEASPGLRWRGFRNGDSPCRLNLARRLRRRSWQRVGSVTRVSSGNENLNHEDFPLVDTIAASTSSLNEIDAIE